MKKLLIAGMVMGCSLTVKAQQTIFNVPSSDIVPRHQVMAQQQVEFNSEVWRSTTTFGYGLGRQWEVGLNLYNLEYLPNRHTWLRNDTTTQIAYAPLLLINAQKTVDLTESLHLGVGGQTGFDPVPTHRGSWAGWGYVNLGANFADDRYKTVIGLYAGNRCYLGDGPSAGLHLGFDAGIWYEKIHLLGDWATGSHEYGQLIMGVEVYLTKHLPLAVGWRRSNQDGKQALVLQVTYTPE